jgi:hypothetical protein
MTIRFHYHRASRDVPRLGIEGGDRLCHVYSDTSLDELLTWGRSVGLDGAKLDMRNDLPHFDAFGPWLRHCGDGVSRQQFVRDVRRWRRSQQTRGQ